MPIAPEMLLRVEHAIVEINGLVAALILLDQADGNGEPSATWREAVTVLHFNVADWTRKAQDALAFWHSEGHVHAR